MPAITIIICCYFLLTALAYFIVMLSFWKGLKKYTSPAIHHNTEARTFITVFVCFRNEEHHLPHLLQHLVNQIYSSSLFEIVLYDDDSGDASADVINNFALHHPDYRILYRKVPKQADAVASKKLALKDAALNSNAELMVVTDADCILHKNWLSGIEKHYHRDNAVMIAGPVAIQTNNDWFNELQTIELHCLAGVTAGAIAQKKPLMCNGANMAFHRKTFLALDPYQGNYHLGSGDDSFLLMAMHKNFPEQISFMLRNEALVYTHAKRTIKDYIQQRVRWASKSRNIPNVDVKLVALMVLNCNAALILLPLLLWLGQQSILLIPAFIIMKQLGDMLLLQEYTKKVNLKANYAKLLYYQYIEAFLTFIVAVKSIRGNYVWKERKL